MRYRDAASFGKRQEFIAMGALLKRGFDVYVTLVDDQQIDFVVRLDREPPVYIDVQVKARSNEARNPGTFAGLTIKKPRPNFFFMFYSEAADCYWILPSLDVVKLATQNKGGKNAGKFRLVFTNTGAKGQVRARPKWDAYKDNFDLLLSAHNPWNVNLDQSKSAGINGNTVSARVTKYLTERRPNPFCDDCIFKLASLTRRQQAHRVTSALGTTADFKRAAGHCSECGKTKLVIHKL